MHFQKLFFLASILVLWSELKPNLVLFCKKNDSVDEFYSLQCLFSKIKDHLPPNPQYFKDRQTDFLIKTLSSLQDKNLYLKENDQFIEKYTLDFATSQELHLIFITKENSSTNLFDQKTVLFNEISILQQDIQSKNSHLEQLTNIGIPIKSIEKKFNDKKLFYDLFHGRILELKNNKLHDFDKTTTSLYHTAKKILSLAIFGAIIYKSIKTISIFTSKMITGFKKKEKSQNKKIYQN